MSELVGKKVSHQRIKVAELAANPEALKAFVQDGDKYVLTQVIAGKDWGIGTIWKLVQDADGPVLARQFDGVAPDGLRIINEGSKGADLATKTASIHAPAADVTERLASGISTGQSEMDQNVTPIVLDWVEAGWMPGHPNQIARMAQEQYKAGKLTHEEAQQICTYASRIFPVVQGYVEAKMDSMFGPAKTEKASGSLDKMIQSLAAHKPKNMSWGKFANAVKILIESKYEKKGGEIPPQFLKKKDEKPEAKDAKPGEKKPDAKPGDKKDEKPADKKDEGKKLPPWLEKKDK